MAPARRWQRASDLTTKLIIAVNTTRLLSRLGGGAAVTVARSGLVKGN
jgi:hypothetical protein